MNEKLNYFSAIKFLMKYIKGYKKNFIMFYVGWLLDSVLTVIMPILLGIMIDEIVYYQNLESFIKVSLLFLVCIIFSGGLYFLIYAQHGYLMNMFVFSIRQNVIKHLQKSDSQYLSNASTGDIIAVIQRYSSECMHFIIRNIIHMVNAFLLIILYGGYLIFIDWRIGIIAFCSAVFSGVVNTKFNKKVRKLGDEERKYYGEYISWMYEIITALRDIRVLGASEKVGEDFEKKQKKILRLVAKNKTTIFMAENLITFIQLAIRLSIYTLSAYLAVKGNVTLGVLTVIYKFYDKFSDRVSSVSMSYLDAQNRISYIQKIYDLLQTPVEQGGSREINICEGGIVFQNISFGYGKDNTLLRDINLKIEPGEHVALVGKSGCGKTTLAYLLIGFYKLKAGKILIDGQSLADCNLESIRKQIGLVQQDVLIFDGTIRHNLLMGNLHASDSQLKEACQSAGLGEFIDSLDKGLDTVIGKQGIGLSGGQKQRIAIARIFLKDPKIVIFDEATSALDSKTEEAVHEVWKKNLVGKTAIIIAHRQSSVMLCDCAAILEEGRIVEMGEPADMGKSSERFRKLFAIGKEE